jgi:hypothetical protein
VIQEDLSGCSVLLGVKEVMIDTLLPGKTYLFFSHTAKEQPYNRELLQAIVEKGVRIVDYEYLTDPDHVRVVAFGRWAGVVGAYNGLRGLGLREKLYDLPPAHTLKDLREMKASITGLNLGNTRIVVTGGGRVAGGALEILEAARIPAASPDEYLEDKEKRAVYTRLDPWHYTRRKDGKTFDFDEFVSNPESFENDFLPYAKCSDMFIACHFWDPRSPVMLTREDLASKNIPISIVADISCDIDGPIALDRVFTPGLVSLLLEVLDRPINPKHVFDALACLRTGVNTERRTEFSAVVRKLK